MSTRNVLASGDRFSLWKEIHDTDESLYLRVTCCEACGHAQTMKIPVEVWETIRSIPAVSFTLADTTDEAIHEKVEAEIAEWHADYEKYVTAAEAVPQDDVDRREQREAFARFVAEHPIFGTITDAPEEHRSRGFVFYSGERERLVGIRERMKKHRVYKPDGGL